MTHHAFRCLVFFIVLFGITAAESPVAAGGLQQLHPAAEAGAMPLSAIEHRVMPMIDPAALEAEDEIRENSGLPVAPRFASNISVDLTPDNSGTWEILRDGSRLWRLRLTSPGALSLNLAITTFELPEGGEFWVRSGDGTERQGPYTKGHQNIDGGLWTALVLGDELVAELRVPSGAEAKLQIASVNHGYRFFGEDDWLVPAKRGACNINVVCPDGDPWRDQIRAVARITIQGMWLCTAQLVNNTSNDLTPYLLTAQHCIERSNQAPTVVTYWNYESPLCADLAGGSLSQNQSGSTYIASHEIGTGSDFTLVELDAQPHSSFNVYYLGWDARDQLPSATTVIHHPSGDEKSISFDFDPPTITSYLEDASPGNSNYLRIADWDLATTEGGSSGSALFDSSSKHCIGTLSGGYAACDNDLPDWFGWFHAHWTGAGTPDTRLSDWLDPGATGELTWPGMDANSIFADGFESSDTSAWSNEAP